MLNELLIVERGAREAGVATTPLHPDVKDAGRAPTLLVRLNVAGEIASIRPVLQALQPWTLRDAQQNSFPYVKLDAPLWAVSADGDQLRKTALDRRDARRRTALLDLATRTSINVPELDRWPRRGFLDRLRDRRQQVATLEGTKAAVVPAAIDRFLLACDRQSGGDPVGLLTALSARLVAELQLTAQGEWIDVASALLLGKFNAEKGKWDCAGALLLDTDDAQISITERSLAEEVSRALGQAESAGANAGGSGICALTGRKSTLLTGNFSQPNLRVLGQTFLFSKNADIPANDRYGRFASGAMPVAKETEIGLAAALKALTSDDRRDVTWRDVPGEAPKQNDLLLAFVDAAPDAPVVSALADDSPAEDLSEETPGTESDTSESVAIFEKRTERVIEAVRAKVGADFRRTPVRLAVFRKVDPGNRKVVYAGAPTVGDLHDAAKAWAVGERNVPPWLTLPVFRKGERTPNPMTPPHVAPLGVIAFSRQLFVRQGTERQEIVGIPAAEALTLFLESTEATQPRNGRTVERVLRMVLTRRTALVSGAAHAARRPPKSAREFDRREALRTATLLGLLLHKLDRSKEDYMNDTAFKLGQLLAAADVVHAGYCADVRGGDVPPSLLGNQVFTMAQSAPAKALATLCRRWKPYDGWAKKASRDRARADKLIASKVKAEEQRGWDIKIALKQAREVTTLAQDPRSAARPHR